MTDDELLQLKELALLAIPYADDNDEHLTKEAVEQANINGDFFVDAVFAVPLMVDELLAHRKTRYRMKQGILG